MSISRKQALKDLKNMFPEYDTKALDTLLRANGNLFEKFISQSLIENMLNATIDYILQLNEAE